MILKPVLIISTACLTTISYSQNTPPPVTNPATPPEGYKLFWADEFTTDGKPDSANWSYENGFIRNEELQWYQPDNANIQNGILIIEGRRETVKNHNFDPASKDWKKNREFAQYTASSIQTRNKKTFKFGIIEVRARIDTATGMWPAIWTLGVSKHWPACGEIDIMEFYRIKEKPTILANAAWEQPNGRPAWDDSTTPLSKFLKANPDWTDKFHTWKMDWTENHIRLYLDAELLNEIDLAGTTNPDGFNPFHQPHYLLLNMAIGAHGGDPSSTKFPKKYEVDYVRIYQKK